MDTLLLSLVGSNNIGAFSNFDAFDAVGLNGNLDVDILAAKNTVTEFVTSGDVGGASSLLNIGAGIGYRVTGDAGTTNVMTLTQKTAGALTVTVDTHETTAAAGTGVGAAVHASNATSVNAVFSESFKDDANGAGDNIATLALTTDAATSVAITSNGGSNASNVVTLNDTANKVTAVTVTGATALTLDVTAGNKIATIDSSAATGGLTATVADLVSTGGTIKLGSGADVITATVVSTQAAVSTLSGFEKAAAAAVGTDATAKAAAIADTDILVLATATVAANAASGTLTGTDAIKNGVLTFGGAGPATLAAAIAAADADVTTTGDTVVFKYLNDTYVFSQTGAAADIVVKLSGVTGVTNFAVDGGDATHFFIV